jgi:predicted transcriptional regulator of viral defense system
LHNATHSVTFCERSTISNPGPLHHWVLALPEHGRYTFSRDEAASVSAASPAAVKMTLYRLKQQGAIVSPRRSFFVLVPPEYRSAGCPPATWFIDDLMQHLGRRYYVAMLTAAALHGAGHQQPMAFQVMSDGVERDIAVGRVRIEFHLSHLVQHAALQRVQTETGTMAVATPETTAFDLVRFPRAAGYWSHVATILAELAEKLDPHKLTALVPHVARSDVQRLGWLLERIEQTELADALADVLAGTRLQPTRLTAARDASSAPLDPRWHVVVNDDVEPDL